MFDLFGRKKIAELTQELEETDEILDARDLKIEELEQNARDYSARAQNAVGEVANAARLRAEELQTLVDSLTSHNENLDVNNKVLSTRVAKLELENARLMDSLCVLETRVVQDRNKSKKRKAAKKKSKK